MRPYAPLEVSRNKKFTNYITSSKEGEKKLLHLIYFFSQNDGGKRAATRSALLLFDHILFLAVLQRYHHHGYNAIFTNFFLHDAWLTQNEDCCFLLSPKQKTFINHFMGPHMDTLTEHLVINIISKVCRQPQWSLCKHDANKPNKNNTIQHVL